MIIDRTYKKYKGEIMVLRLEDLCLAPDEIIKNVTSDIIPDIYDYYMITSYGRVFNKFTNSYMSPGVSGAGYNFLELATSHGPQMVQIHRLVLKAFNPIDNDTNFVVNHKDGNKLNNKLSNLEWVTRSMNAIHAFEHNLMPRGEKCSWAKLTEQDVRNICIDILNGERNIDIADKYKISASIVNHIKRKDTWKHISKDYF